MGNTEWNKLIKIDKEWVSNQLESHFQEVNNKVKVKLYTVKVSGTQILPDGIVAALHQMLPDYVYGQKRLEIIGERTAGLQANRFFGKKNPQTDGKYGELLLFALVESVLKCKMVAHKIKSLSNFKDQVKGGDGIFIGNYTIFDGREEPAYLIGESKVQAQYSKALNEAFLSLKRFTGATNSTEFRSTELIVAKENLILDDSIDLDELYNRLNPQTDTFKQQILVHPVLIMYDDTEIKNCERHNNSTRNDLEKSIKTAMVAKKEKIIKSINDKLSSYPEVSKVYLDFFIVPYNDINNFRDAMYYHIHGVSYP